MAVLGLLVTAVAALTAAALNRRNEHHLLQVQTRQAAALLGSTILSIENPLTTSLDIETATGGNVSQFAKFMSAYTGPGRVFVAASLWRSEGATGVRPLASIGVAPAVPPTSAAARQFVTQALHSRTFVVTELSTPSPGRIAYAIADPAAPLFVVYAERAIPADRKVPIENDSAFVELDYATYLGPTTQLSDLATTDVPLAEPPISGLTDHIAFGDTMLTLVTAPRVPLGGALGGELPWFFLVGGFLLTIGTAFVASALVRRRRDAEQDAHTIAGLYDHLEDLYGEQRSIAETLQHALLPQHNPSIPGLEIAARYVAGAEGVDIGGDWYSLVSVDDDHFAFVVGDVSGRGVSAATTMARLRFTIRAYLLEGHRPDVVLGMCSCQLDVMEDEHFSTVLVGVGDLRSREVTVANAGHFNPLVVSGAESRFVDLHVGLPLGVTPATYTCTTFVMPPQSTLVVFTDGLVERRGEDIRLGLDRLAEAALSMDSDFDDVVSGLVRRLVENGSEDDIAILAFRWRVVDHDESEPSTVTERFAQGS